MSAAATWFFFQTLDVSVDSFCMSVRAPTAAVVSAWLGYGALPMLTVSVLPLRLGDRWLPLFIGTILGPLPPLLDEPDVLDAISVWVFSVIAGLLSSSLLLSGVLGRVARRIPMWVLAVTACVGLYLWWRLVPNDAGCATGDSALAGVSPGLVVWATTEDASKKTLRDT